MIGRRLIAGLLALAATVASAPAWAAKQDPRPNFLVIIVDDMNDWAGFMGGQAITPNLDRAAAAGMVFGRAQAAATFCTPSRSALMTGAAPARSGNYRNQPALATTPQLLSFVDVLARHGYEGFGTGKVFHHTAGYLDRRGYAQWFLWNPENEGKGWALLPWGKGSPAPKRPASQIPVYSGWNEFDYAALPDADEPRMADSIAAGWASEVLARPHDKPFVMTFGTYAPHKPNYVPKRYFDLYANRKIVLPIVPPDDLADLPGDPHKAPLCCVSPVKSPLGSGAWPFHAELLAHHDWENAVRAYLASISYADAQIGRVLDALNRGPNRDNTIILFMSDNGYHLGEKDKWAKHSLWQRTTNVPFFVSGPGVRRGRYDGAVSLLDVMPTVLKGAGVALPTWLDGRSLWPVLGGRAQPLGRRVVTAGNRGEWAVTDGRYRYIRYRNGGEELYDLSIDSHEWTNLADDRRMRGVRNRLARAIPARPSPERPSPEMGTLKLVIQGKTFHWEPANEAPGSLDGD